MAEHGSPHETSKDCLIASFQRGWQQQISHQVSKIIRGQEISQATQERHLVLTGQMLEALRRMEKPTAPPSGPVTLTQIKEFLSFLGAIYKAWPVIRWAMYANGFAWAAKHAAKLLGWL